MNSPDIVLPNLGLLRYSNQYNWYEGQINFQQSQISISLNMGDEGVTEALFNKANDLVIRLENYAENAKNYAVEKLLELKNEVWLDENEELLTPEQFKTRIMLKSIAIWSDGVELYHDDGDLFLGHSILVRMDSNDRFIDAHLAG